MEQSHKGAYIASELWEYSEQKAAAESSNPNERLGNSLDGRVAELLEEVTLYEGSATEVDADVLVLAEREAREVSDTDSTWNRVVCNSHHVAVASERDGARITVDKTRHHVACVPASVKDGHSCISKRWAHTCMGRVW